MLGLVNETLGSRVPSTIQIITELPLRTLFIRHCENILASNLKKTNLNNLSKSVRYNELELDCLCHYSSHVEINFSIHFCSPTRSLIEIIRRSYDVNYPNLLCRRLQLLPIYSVLLLYVLRLLI